MKVTSLFSKLWKGKPAKPKFDWTRTPPSPEVPLAVIGDVHGRLDLLEKLLAQIPDEFTKICVGDYIDRGPHSIGVLQYLADRPDITCLKGNHEDMMLDFLSDPEEKGGRWIRNGGLQTLAEVGARGITEMTGGQKLRDARGTLEQALGRDLVTWIDELPVVRWTGNVVVCHAGADPGRSMEEQKERHFIWGHRHFFEDERQDGNWVVHGHTIFDDPIFEGGRISLDTGAFATGRLTAGLISPDGTVRFVAT